MTPNVSIRSALLWLVTAACSSQAYAQAAQSKSVFEDHPPAGAPTDTCKVDPVRDASKLLVVIGDNALTYVFACGRGQALGKCVSMTEVPGSRDLPRTMRFTSSGIEKNGWQCVSSSEGVSGWIRSDRVSALPPIPAITAKRWIGWWHQGRDVAGFKNNRLLITTSKVNAAAFHVSGRAYWYGAENNVHFGEVNAEASAFGDTLHIVEGVDEGSCMIDLVYHQATNNFTAIDNDACGGMNVRFLGEWQRFQPRRGKD